MGEINSLDSIIITPLSRIKVQGGDVLHGMKKSDLGFNEFGEAYFSIVEFNAVKAWKKHLTMTLNLVVPSGEVKFVFLAETGNYREIIIGESNYCRLTVPPNLWFGFVGQSECSLNLVLNISDILHDPNEVVRADKNSFNYKWI